MLICVSAAPLAGYREGWLSFHQNDMKTMYLRDLNLQPWNHYINYGYAMVQHPSETARTVHVGVFLKTGSGSYAVGQPFD